MKKFLPKTKNNTSGFTLVELLVVISIIAILSVIGITLFSGVQKGARDTRRRGDIDSISKALEVNKTPNSQTYNVLAPTQFAGGSIPVDSINGIATYCVRGTATVGAPPAVPSAWVNTAACPSSYSTISVTAPGALAASWTICALLETGTNSSTPSNIYCKQSSQ